MIWKLATLHFQFLEVWPRLFCNSDVNCEDLPDGLGAGLQHVVPANGTETITVVPVSNSIYDGSGQYSGDVSIQ